MHYRFTIQASNPRSLQKFDPSDATLSDAMQTVFPLEAECAVMSWNWIHVLLTYGNDLSMMVDDVLSLVDRMLSEPNGTQTIAWPSNTFASTWRIEWNGDTTTVNADWLSVLGGVEHLLTDKSRIVVETGEFVSEWKRPLELITAALAGAGYGANLPGLDRLRAVAGKIARPGLLYRE